MTTLVMTSDYQQFGRNMSYGNKKSIKDLIKKFDTSNDKRQNKSQHIDLTANLNSLKLSVVNNKDNLLPVSLNFESIKIPIVSETVHYRLKDEPNSFINTINRSSKTLNEHADDQKSVLKSVDSQLRTLDEKHVEPHRILSEKSNDEENDRKLSFKKNVPLNKPAHEANSKEPECTWNPTRRRSSVQLLKPSSLVKNRQDDKIEEETVDAPETIVLPKRFTGPIYESRRTSFSAIKPSEIWDPDELPIHNRRNSKILSKTILINRKKSIAIQEIDESLENVSENKSSWVIKKPTPSMNIVKPSNVKTVETSGPKKLNVGGIQNQMLKWCQNNTKNYSNVDIKNFSSSWANGLAFCALIHNFKPEAFNYEELNATDRRKNFEIAFSAAEKHANITPLLEVDDMILMGDKPDSKCVFTYISTIYSKLSKLK